MRRGLKSATGKRRILDAVSDDVIVKRADDVGETWIPVVPVGPTANGWEVKDEYIRQMMSNFGDNDPPVMCFVGHNDGSGVDERPAIGRVAELMYDGQVLWARPEEVTWQMRDCVNSGSYPNISGEFWKDWRGVKPGWSLTGIAFIGSNAPATKLPRIQKLSAAGSSRRIVCSAVQSMGPVRTITRKEEVSSQAGDPDRDEKLSKNSKTEGGEKEMDAEEMKKLVGDVIKEATPSIVSTLTGSAEFKALAARTEAVETQNQALQEKLTASEQNAKVAGETAKLTACNAFADKLLADKKITPAEHEGLGAYLATLDDAKKLKFTATGPEQSQLEFEKAKLSARKPMSALFEAGDHDDNGEQAPDEIKRMAAQHGLDEKVLMEQYAALRKGLAAGGDKQAELGKMSMSINSVASK